MASRIASDLARNQALDGRLGATPDSVSACIIPPPLSQLPTTSHHGPPEASKARVCRFPRREVVVKIPKAIGARSL
jgi:hypothetical protein